MRWKPIIPCIILACLQTWHFNITIIHVYAPTKNTKNIVKDFSYDQLQDEIIATLKHDFPFLICDLMLRSSPSSKKSREHLRAFIGCDYNLTCKHVMRLTTCVSKNAGDPLFSIFHSCGSTDVGLDTHCLLIVVTHCPKEDALSAKLTWRTLLCQEHFRSG